MMSLERWKRLFRLAEFRQKFRGRQRTNSIIYRQRRMVWIGLAQLNDALCYIEEHLAGEIDLNTVARLACCPCSIFSECFPIWQTCRLRSIFEGGG